MSTAHCIKTKLKGKNCQIMLLITVFSHMLKTLISGMRMFTVQQHACSFGITSYYLQDGLAIDVAYHLWDLLSWHILLVNTCLCTLIVVIYRLKYYCEWASYRNKQYSIIITQAYPLRKTRILSINFIVCMLISLIAVWIDSSVPYSRLCVFSALAGAALSIRRLVVKGW